MGLLGKLEGFGKAVWDAGNEVVDVIGDVDAVVEGVGAIAGFIGRIGKSTHLDDLIEVGERLGGWAERVGLNKFLRAADSPILDGGQVVIAGMKLTTGIGEPEHGDRFGRGGARFHDAGTTLRSAQPTASWSGEGADAYAAQNVSQTARTKAIAAVDHEVHRVIAAEASQVGFHRDRLDDWSNFLADFGLVTFALGLIPGVGIELKAAAEINAVLAAVASSSIELYQMSSEAEANATELQQLVGRYDSVAQAANLSATGVYPDPPPSPPPSPSSAPSEHPPTDGPHGQQPGNGSATPPSPSTPMPASSGPGRFAPSVPTAGGPGSGGGAASPTSGGRPAAPSVDMPLPAEGPPQAASDSTGAPSATGALPGIPGGMPLAPMGAGAAPPAASAVPMTLIKEAVQAAMQHEADKQAEARKSDGHDDEDKDGKPDSDEALDDDKDGDGKPDASGEEKAEVVEEDERATAAGGVDGGRAPVHVEMDVDAEQLLTPITVTLDRKNPIGSPPASAT